MVVRLAILSRAGLVVVTVILMAALAGCDRSVVPSGYEGSPDSQRLTLIVEGGIGDSITSSELVSQTSDAVTVEVKMKSDGGNYPDVGRELRVTVQLENPLGNRVVRDVTGAEIPPIN